MLNILLMHYQLKNETEEEVKSRPILHVLSKFHLLKSMLAKYKKI